MRGKVSGFVILVCAKRITPAYAGKSSGTVRGTLRSRDHPRLCGEKPDNEFDEEYFEGSPPPMRGKAATEPEDDQTAGITPAYAGKSYGITEVYDNKKGSPPPMRGKG